MNIADEEPRTAYQDDLIGEHPSIVEARKLIERVIESPVRTVLIYGETGTGKGVVARMLHRRSQRVSNPFIYVNCAAIPTSLIESELFGFEKGAFTGATAQKKGRIELANKGTLFLDEIRELDLVSQGKLLGFLDTYEIWPIGSVKSRQINVRLVTTTNVNLLGEVRAGRFREDLYYRLQVMAINIPPLRDRGDDILLLSELFLRRYSQQYGRVISRMEPAVVDLFKAYSWPGNVRELENLIEREFVLGEGDSILVSHLPSRIIRSVEEGEQGPPLYNPVKAGGISSGETRTSSKVDSVDYHEATAVFQRQLIEQAMSKAHGNIAVMSHILGLTRHALRHQITKLFGQSPLF